MKTRTASCTCGQLRVQVHGEPLRVGLCHCLACQQRTGSPFGQQASFSDDGFVVTGTASTYVRTGDGGTRATFRFCPTCGSTVYFTAEGREGKVVVPVGAFADPGFPAPTISVYEERMHAWVQLPAGIEHMA